MSSYVTAACIALLALPCLAAGSIAGTWSIALDPDFVGNSSTLSCDFSEAGGTLGIDCGDWPASDLTISDGRVRFVIYAGETHLLPAKFSGALSDDGRGITGTWTMQDVSGNRNGRFSATPSPAPQ